MSFLAPGRTLNRRVTVTVLILTIVSAVIFAAIMAMFVRLQGSDRRTSDSIRENAVWTAYQGDREAGRLVEFILLAERNPGPELYTQVIRRYDVLYSRAETILQAKFAFDIAADAEVGELSKAVRAAIMDLAPLFDEFAAKPETRLEALPTLLRRADAVRELTESFTLKVYAADGKFRAEKQAFVRGTYVTIAIGVVTLILALVAVVALLFFQIIHISRTGRRLEELSARNARAAEAAEAGTRAKSAFLASMSHEIRTPLNGIIGMSEVLSETPLSEDQREQIKVIRQSGDLLLDVINDVLDFSKVESGAIDICEVEFNLPDLLASIEAVMSPRAVSKGLSLNIAAQSLAITTDPARLRQVLINLVGNAIKFTETGFVTVKAFADSCGQMRFEVSDTGIGIDEPMQPRLFKEFSQIDSSITRRFGGTGLGLAICKRLIEALGGEIGMRSKLNQGSLFWFYLPVGKVKPVERTVTVAEAPQVFKGTVLVVEDNPINQQVASRLLGRMGLTVDCVDNGAEALEKLSVRRFDLVLMDMQMPVLDGLAATRALRARGDVTPIVGLTANAFVSDREACLDAGMDGFMSKPVTRSKLSLALKPWFSASASTEEPLPEAAPLPVETDGPRIDADYRAALVEEIGEEVVAHLIEAFVIDALSQIEGARLALRKGEKEVCDLHLHTLKGAAYSLGFSEIGSFAQNGRGTALDQKWFDQLEQLIRGVATPNLGPVAA